MKNRKESEIIAQKKSGLFTALIAAVFCGLLFLSFKIAVPDMEQEGMMIDFGYDATGFGEIEPSSAQTTSTTASEAQTASSQNEVITQTIEKSVTVKDKPSKNNTSNTTVNNNKTETQNTQKQETIDDNMIFKGDKKFEGNSKSEGNTGGPGNQGDPSGDPNGGGKGGEGNNPDGVGVGHDLKGRSIIKKELTSNSLESGKIVFKISVDKNGYIRSATYERTGSTIVDQGVINNVKNQLLNKQWFQPKSDAAETQEGHLSVNITLG